MCHPCEQSLTCIAVIHYRDVRGRHDIIISVISIEPKALFDRDLLTSGTILRLPEYGIRKAESDTVLSNKSSSLIMQTVCGTLNGEMEKRNAVENIACAIYLPWVSV